MSYRMRYPLPMSTPSASVEGDTRKIHKPYKYSLDLASGTTLFR